MALENYNGKTFVAFLDISGFRELMRSGKEKAERALDIFYQSGYDVLLSNFELKGIFVSDSGILYSTDEQNSETIKLKKILEAVKFINEQMLDNDFMLKTSIAFGEFSYSGRIELPNISKSMILGNAYTEAFIDNDKVKTGMCRIIDLPNTIIVSEVNFPLLKQKGKYYYYYWNIPENADNKEEKIDNFIKSHKDSYQLKFEGILKALKNT